MNNGGPAFPHRELNSDGQYEFSAGMTLRDWFAGLAMQGIITDTLDAYEDVATQAYKQADAMLKAREAER